MAFSWPTLASMAGYDWIYAIGIATVIFVGLALLVLTP
jgi:hypothetical protein